MTNKNANDQQKGQKSGGTQTPGRQGPSSDDNQQQAYNQGGHAGARDPVGQQSGGMGGNESDNQQSGSPRGQQTANPGIRQQGGRMGNEETAEIQQSAQREGMGSHRHSSRTNEQALDAASDVDSLGSQNAAAGKSREDKPRR